MKSATQKKDTRVLISGASVAGLSVAYWLARYGFKVTVVERAPHLRPGGQALDVRGPALAVAERMGILPEIRQQKTHLTGMSIVDAAGQETYRSTNRTLTGGHFDSPDVEILRDDLCRVLHAAVGDHADYVFGDAITSLREDEDGVQVTFTTAAPRHFDLVIGADGLRSGVRRLTFGPDEQFLHYLGTYVAVFTIPNFLGLEHWQVFHQGETFGVGYLVLGKNTEARIYAGFNSREPLAYRDVAAQKQLLTERAAGAGWEIPRIMDYMRQAPYFHFDSASQVRMPGWSRGRIVLLGDAGYSVSFTTGQGTTVAMVGAYVLAGELAVHRGDLLAGVRSYENEMRDYVLRNQELVTSVDANDTDLSSLDPGTRTIPLTLKDYAEFFTV